LGDFSLFALVKTAYSFCVVLPFVFHSEAAITHIESIALTARKTTTTVIVTMTLKRFSAV